MNFVETQMHFGDISEDPLWNDKQTERRRLEAVFGSRALVGLDSLPSNLRAALSVGIFGFSNLIANDPIGLESDRQLEADWYNSQASAQEADI